MASTVPMFAGNLAIAKAFFNDDVRMVVLSDSRWSLAVEGRIGHYISRTSKVPTKGFFTPSSVPNSTGGSFGNPGSNIGDNGNDALFFSWETWFTVSADGELGNKVCNYYRIDGSNAGTWEFVNTGRTFDSATEIVTPAGPGDTQAIPQAYREYHCSPSTPYPNGTIVLKVKAALSGLNHHYNVGAATVADPFAQGDVTTARYIYWKHAAAPTSMSMYVSRGGSGTAVPFSMNDATGLAFSEATKTGTSTSAQLEVHIVANANSAFDGTTTCMNVMGLTVYRGALAAGVWYVPLGNSSWNTDTWTAANVSDAGYANYISMAAGLDVMKPNGTQPKLVFVIDLGQNQTAAEVTDLNAGNVAVFKASLKAVRNRFKNIANSLGYEPWFIFVPPYECSNYDNAPRLDKTRTNSEAMVKAHYEVALETGGFFLNMYRAMPGSGVLQAGKANATVTYEERVLTDVVKNTINTGGAAGPGIHPYNVGSRMISGAFWGVLETANLTLDKPLGRR